MNFLIVFIVSFVHSLVATLEVLNIAHLRRLGTALYGTFNSGLAFVLIYVVVVDDTSRAWLIIPWIMGDVLAGQCGISWFKRKK